VAKSAIFIDCDGVLDLKADRFRKIEDLHLLPEAATAIRKLNDLNLFCCLVSNQSGPAQNHYPLSYVDALHERLGQLLYSQAKAKLDAFYYCPYLSPAAGGINPEFMGWSAWRKPNTGMLIAAAWEHNLNLQNSFVIANKNTDIDLAHNVGAKGILVQTENSKKPRFLRKNGAQGIQVKEINSSDNLLRSRRVKSNSKSYGNQSRKPVENPVTAPSILQNEQYLTRPDYIANNLREAVRWISNALDLSKSHSSF
jgi:D-glycero-D-manno-heptose 1,7-bisphosphate phosphatase